MVMTLEQENSARNHNCHKTTIFTHYKKFDWAMENQQKTAIYDKIWLRKQKFSRLTSQMKCFPMSRHA